MLTRTNIYHEVTNSNLISNKHHQHGRWQARVDEFAVGLHNEFQPLIGHDIGQFPDLESKLRTNSGHIGHST